MIPSTRYKDCEVVIGVVKTYINLIRLGKMEFDVILGMDWLPACYAYVDCCEKRLIFQLVRPYDVEHSSQITEVIAFATTFDCNIVNIAFHRFP